MKKIFFFSVLLLSTFGYSQCAITGPSAISQGATVAFSVPANLAQCTECYDWDVSGPAAIIGSDQNNLVSITRTGVGSININVTYFDENGCHTCSSVVSSGDVACCVPSLEISFACRGNGGASGSLGGFVTLIMPEGCDWSNIEKIYFELDSPIVFGVYTPLANQQQGYINAPFDVSSSNPNLLRYAIYAPRCVSYTYLYATIYYKSANCPPKRITAEFNNPSQLRVGATDELILSPNPVKNEISFSGKLDQNSKISIFDSEGNSIMESEIKGDKLNVEKLKKGLYVYTISGSESIQSGKFIKE